MKRAVLSFGLVCCLLLGLSGCTQTGQTQTQSLPDETLIDLSDAKVLVNGKEASTDSSSSVYLGSDLVSDQSGQAEADKQTVVHVTQPGTYRITGVLSAGQLAVDLGTDAAENPDAVVTLILDGADISCSDAPAVIFYRVFEYETASGSSSAEAETTDAGAQVVLADDSNNKITGSYAAECDQEDSSDPLSTCSGALCSCMTMSIGGETDGSGTLTVTGEKDGISSAAHLTINSGTVKIEAQNDGISTVSEQTSVTEINGGSLSVDGGLSGLGNGIHSSGWVTINDGSVVATGSQNPDDCGIAAQKGIRMNGGSVIATGNTNSTVSSSSQQTAINLTFLTSQVTGTVLAFADQTGKDILNYTTGRDFLALTFSDPGLEQDESYFLYANGVQQQYVATHGKPKKSTAAQSGTTDFTLNAQVCDFSDISDVILIDADSDSEPA